MKKISVTQSQGISGHFQIGLVTSASNYGSLCREAGKTAQSVKHEDMNPSQEAHNMTWAG